MAAQHIDKPAGVSTLTGTGTASGASEFDLTRREMLQKGISLAGWGAIFVGGGIGIREGIRYFYPSVVFHPPSTVRIGRVADFTAENAPDAHGVILVDNSFKKDHRFFVVREAGRIYALFARCTHLGCTVNWFPGINVFKCPCHGSEFYSNGKEFAGPAPRPLDRLKISLGHDGDIVVDTAVVYSASEFEKQKIFIQVA